MVHAIKRYREINVALVVCSMVPGAQLKSSVAEVLEHVPDIFFFP